MASAAPKYYRPYYPSDSEESDASSDDSAAEDSSREIHNENAIANLPNLPNFASFAQGLYRAAGPPFSSDSNIDFSQNILDRNTVYGPMVEGQEGYEIVTTTQQADNVIVLQSLDRDKLVYPQPVNCQLMLPRTYVNVTRFEIADISFIASFFYFRADKYNISLQFTETGRVLYSKILLNPSILSPLNLNITLREGTYTIDTLLQEVTTQFNTPPLFYDFLNGYSDFYNIFIREGDYSINFNYPGDYYYDSVRRVYITNPTRPQIVSYYFQQRYALPTSKSINNTFTDIQTKVAYYYPVLKEFLLDTNYAVTSSDVITYNGLLSANKDSPYKVKILYNFTGLDDIIVSEILQDVSNLSVLNAYRLSHTFRYFPVNNYICTYSTQNTIVSIQAASLNTSLVSLLNSTYSNFLTTQIQRTGTSLEEFNVSSPTITAYKSILSDMYNILQSNFSHMFGVDYGTLSDTYFVRFSNVILLKNGLYASNVLYNYNTQTSPFLTSNIQNNFLLSNTPYWQRMTNIRTANQSFSTTTLDATSGKSVYNTRVLTVQNEHPFQGSGGIYINPVEHTSDVIVNVSPGVYTILPILSKIRQTAQVETLPRPSIYLYPEWNSANRDAIGFNQYEFSNGAYTYQFPTGSSLGIGSNISYPLFPALINLGIASNIFSSYLMQTANTLSLTTTPSGLYFSFTTPTNPTPAPASVSKYTMGLSIFAGTNSIPLILNGIVTDGAMNTFADSFYIFVYHDQAAFFADVGPIGQANGESSFFYKYTATLAQGSEVQTISFSAYENQTYYVYCRPVNKLTYSPITFTLVPYIKSNAPITLYCNVNFDPRLSTFNPYIQMQSNFYIAKVHDPDYIRLPIIDSNGFYYKTNIKSSNIGFLPSASNGPATAPINILLKKPVVPLGYSSGNISDDLTDYIPIANTYPPRGYDTINGYQFRYTPGVNSYNPISQTYDVGITTGTLINRLLGPDGSIYSMSNDLTRREKKIVQYTGTHYIATGSNAFTSHLNASNLKPLSSNSIPGLRSPFEHRGACGFLFMPEEGTWSIKRLTILCQTASTNVHFLAIFPTAYITGVTLKNISVANALALCVLVSSNTFIDTPAEAGVPYGTYYTYSNVLVPLSNYVISGKTQSSATLVTDTNSYYSAIAYSFVNPSTLSNTTFTLNDFLPSFLTEIENLTGTCIPYPDLGLKVSQTFYDGKVTPDPAYTMIVSSNRPLNLIGADRTINPTLNSNFNYVNYYTSQYAQSSPIVNAHVHYAVSEYAITDFIYYVNYFLTWNSVPDIPTYICTTIDGHLLFQTSEFPIVSYITYQETTTFDLVTTVTEDMIFPAIEQTSILSQSGTSTSYLFLGCTSTSKLVFKEYVLATGEIKTYAYLSPSFNAQTNIVQGFAISGTQWWLCYLDGASGMNIAYGSNFTDSYTTMLNGFTGPYTSAKLSLDPVNGTNVYFALSSNANHTFSTVYSYPISDMVPITNDLAQITPYVVSSNSSALSVQYIIDREYVYLIRNASSYVYRLDTVTSLNASIPLEVQSGQNLGHQPVGCMAGINNAIWIIFDTFPYIMAYVFTVDSIHIGWQLLFPVMKIELYAIDEVRLAIPDTDNITTPEWYHSVLFSYSNQVSMLKDIQYTGSNILQWGQEANFETSDPNFGGYYFNAYLQDVPLQAGTSYVTLRGFTPTESFQTALRISLPNVYDFGYVSINDIISEIGTLANLSNYSVGYNQQLSTFNSAFIRSNQDALYGISSFSVPTTGFSNFIVEYSTIYGKYTKFKSNTDIINASLLTSMNTFLTNDMKYILPSDFLSRTRFTDALTFSFLWKSGLSLTPASIANLADGWGLGWNLGFPKVDDTIPSTVHFAPAMYKIIDDFLYLRLNPEFNLNRMSAGTKENYIDSREPSGLTSYYYCKLLLNGYGQTATTFVHSPIILNPPIAKISKISFQWIDSRGNLLNIPSATHSDWQMTVNIQENVQTTTFFQTSNISAISYLQPTKE